MLISGAKFAPCWRPLAERPLAKCVKFRTIRCSAFKIASRAPSPNFARRWGLPSIDGVRTVGLEGEELRVAKLKELAEMAAKLLETARKLPPGQDRHNALQEVGRLRVRITGLERPDLRSVHRGSRRKNDSSGTPEEDGLLRSMGAAGESTNAIATLLEHSPYAVLKRAHLLKIKLARSQPGLKVKK
jgi:hypothetical protein